MCATNGQLSGIATPLWTKSFLAASNKSPGNNLALFLVLGRLKWEFFLSHSLATRMSKTDFKVGPGNRYNFLMPTCIFNNVYCLSDFNHVIECTQYKTWKSHIGTKGKYRPYISTFIIKVFREKLDSTLSNVYRLHLDWMLILLFSSYFAEPFKSCRYYKAPSLIFQGYCLT